MKAEEIIERILFGKGGSKEDYVNLIKEYAKAKCKEQREICAKKADYYMIELGEFGTIFPTVRIKRKEIKNATLPDFE